MDTYRLTVYVTYEQEMAIHELFTYRGWTFTTCNDFDNMIIVKSEVEPQEDSVTGTSCVSLHDGDYTHDMPKILPDNSTSKADLENVVVVKSEVETDNESWSSIPGRPEEDNSTANMSNVALETKSTSVNPVVSGLMCTFSSDFNTVTGHFSMTLNNRNNNNASQIMPVETDNQEDGEGPLPFTYTSSAYPEGFQNNDVDSGRKSQETCSDLLDNNSDLVALKTRNKALQVQQMETLSKTNQYKKSNQIRNELQNEGAKLAGSEVPPPGKGQIPLNKSKLEEIADSLPMIKRKRPKYSDRKMKFFCEFCQKPFPYHYDYSIHVNRHKKNKTEKCPVCEKLFYVGDLSQHMHIHSENRHKHLCDICGEKFAQSGGLKSHIFFKHEDHPQKEHKCFLCDSAFLTASLLKQHVKIVHSIERLFTCETCGKSFKQKTKLKRHSAVHSDVYPYKCDFTGCEKNFKTKDLLRMHSKRHSGEKTHFCETCGKGFYETSDLNLHIRTHTGVKPCVCDICGFKCALPGNLKKHKKVHK
ncbi:ZN251-like protein [Mya arenaria]|uniref:ZN251-like protein n=1 Tax=Mya arenaria TaxID=6604 RepID=A0ABY7FVP2_MYAAR|nr:zinc finger protein 684-like [Mya arenaria]WAR25122.1 ZN251-like protein [Mya arenaria]